MRFKRDGRRIHKPTFGKKPSGNFTFWMRANSAIRKRSAIGILPRIFQLATTFGATESSFATLLLPPKISMISVAMPLRYHSL